jgi:hypothetical protein
VAYLGTHRPDSPWWRRAAAAVRKGLWRARTDRGRRPAGYVGRRRPGRERTAQRARGTATVHGSGAARGYSGTHRAGAVAVRGDSRHGSGQRARRGARGDQNGHRQGTPAIRLLATIEH